MLLALREQIQRDLDDNPSPPRQPSYYDMRRDILSAQPHLLGAFLKSISFTDGSTLEGKFEAFQRRSFAAHQRRNSDALGRYSGPDYEQWKGRSLEMQRKIVADSGGLGANEVSDAIPAQPESVHQHPLCVRGAPQTLVHDGRHPATVPARNDAPIDACANIS